MHQPRNTKIGCFYTYDFNSKQLLFVFAAEEGCRYITLDHYEELCKKNTPDSEKTLKYLRLAINTIIYMHTFPGCVVDGTPDEIKNERFQRLNKKVQENCLKSNLKYEGRTMEVLIESFYERNGVMINTGKTRNNKTVHIPYNEDLTGQFVNVKISKAKTWYLKGEKI